MSIRSISHPLSRSYVILGAFLFLLVIGLGTVNLAERMGSAGADSATPAVDPRLVLHPHTVVRQGRLTSDQPFTVTIYPALPGVNRLRLTPRSQGQLHIDLRKLGLIADMTGMAMTPTRGSLTRHGRSYDGRLALPMFGRYRIRVVALSGAIRQVGIVYLTLPL